MRILADVELQYILRFIDVVGNKDMGSSIDKKGEVTKCHGHQRDLAACKKLFC